MPGAYVGAQIMAKQKSTKGLTRKQQARREKERKIQRILTWVSIGVITLIVAVLGYGLVTELIIKARKPVARIDDVQISTKAYQSRLRYERLMMSLELAQYESYINQFDPNDETMQSFIQQLQFTASNLETQLSSDFATTLGRQVLDLMIEEELVRKEAEARALTVDENAIDRQVEVMIGYDRDAITTTETLTDTTAPMTEAEFTETYSSFKSNVLEPSQLSEQAYRAMVEADLLKSQLQNAMTQDMQTIEDQVEITFLITSSEEAGQVLQNRINNGGEDPDAIIEELEADEDDQSSGFTLPWLPLGYISSQLGQEFEQVAFNTPVGRAADPILSGELFYVIYVEGHEERELSDDLLASAQEQYYNEWLTQQKEERTEYLEWESAVLTEP